MDTLLEILSAKPRGVIATSTAATVRQATRLMNDHGIGSLLVTSGNRLVGIFTERDVLRRVVAEGRSPDSTTVGEVMTCDVVCCPPEAGVEDAADIMRRRRVRPPAPQNSCRFATTSWAGRERLVWKKQSEASPCPRVAARSRRSAVR